MEQFDDTCKALTTFRMAAAAQVAATECGDYKKATMPLTGLFIFSNISRD